MSVWRIFAYLSLINLFGPVGCAVNPPAQLYQLDIGIAPVSKKESGVAVLIGPVQIADYLRRDAMVQRQVDGILNLSTSARWAGNLETNICQQLLWQMSSELGSSRMALFPEEPGFTPQVQIMLTISRFDSGPRQPAVIEARWRLLDQKGELKDSRVFREEERHGGNVRDQVRAQSYLLRRLAAQLVKGVQTIAAAATVEEEKTSPVVSTRKPVVAVEPKIKEEEPNMPLVMPIRNEVEVYRF